MRKTISQLYHQFRRRISKPDEKANGTDAFGNAPDSWKYVSQPKQALLSEKPPAKTVPPYRASPDPVESARKCFTQELNDLTKIKIWKWETFRKILICLVKLGEGNYVPAIHRPDIIFLDGLQPTFVDLRNLSFQHQGRETSRVVFVDRERSCLVISGITHVGSLTNVKLNLSTQPGRERFQTPALTIHVHPEQGADIGLSDLDYISFLSDKRQIAMLICYQGGIMFTMKTSSTPNQISNDIAKRLVELARRDIHSLWSNLRLPSATLAFNKVVCMEFGMTLYKTEISNENLARRIEVTQ